MKKLITILLCAVLVLSAVGCAEQAAGTGEVGAANGGVQVSDEVLEAYGVSPEDFAALSQEEQQALLDEIGADFDMPQQEAPRTTEAQKSEAAPTPEDVMAGGSYMVVLGDYMNSITLYYENGVLVKLVESFQKNSEEEEETVVYEGDDLEAYSFNFIDWSGAPLQDILDGMRDYGGYGQYTIESLD